MLPKTLNNIVQAIDKLPISIRRDAMYEQLKVSGEISELSSIVFDELSNVGTSRMNIRLIANGRDLHPALFIKSRIGNGLIEHSLLDIEFVTQCLNEGGTFVFDHINDHVICMRAIQEHIESTYGLKCWIQCYVTKANSTAFDMHADDHSFIVLQLHGSKHWVHEDNETVDYFEGDMVFYPKGKKHDVHGKGQVSMHLTIAFEGFDGLTYSELTPEKKLLALKPRVGSALPFSIDPNLNISNSSFRAYYNFMPPYIDKGEYISLTTPRRTIKLKRCYLNLLKQLQCYPSTTISEMSSKFDIEPNRIDEFVRFGIANGLIIRGL